MSCLMGLNMDNNLDRSRSLILHGPES
jgi:hypothetical protein